MCSQIGIPARSSRRPGRLVRDWTHARGTPNTNAHAVAHSDVNTDSRNATLTS